MNLEFFKEIDFLSYEPKLYLKGRQKLKNKLGALLSILMIVVGLAGFFYFFSKVLERSDPFVSMNKVFAYESNYTMNTSETIFAFRITNRIGQVVDDTYYTAIAQYWKYVYSKDENGNDVFTNKVQDLKVTKCP